MQIIKKKVINMVKINLKRFAQQSTDIPEGHRLYYLLSKPIKEWTEEEELEYDEFVRNRIENVEEEEEEEEEIVEIDDKSTDFSDEKQENIEQIIQNLTSEELLRVLKQKQQEERPVPLSGRIKKPGHITLKKGQTEAVLPEESRIKFPETIDISYDIITALAARRENLQIILNSLKKSINLDEIGERKIKIIQEFENVKYSNKILKETLENFENNKIAITINLKRYAQTGRDIKVFRRPPGAPLNWRPPGMTQPVKNVNMIDKPAEKQKDNIDILIDRLKQISEETQKISQNISKYYKLGKEDINKKIDDTQKIIDNITLIIENI